VHHTQFFKGWPKTIESLRRKKLDGGGLDGGEMEEENQEEEEKNVVRWEMVVEMDHVVSLVTQVSLGLFSDLNTSHQSIKHQSN